MPKFIGLSSKRTKYVKNLKNAKNYKIGLKQDNMATLVVIQLRWQYLLNCYM